MKELFFELPLYRLLPVVLMLVSLLLFLVSTERRRHFELQFEELNNHKFFEPQFDEEGRLTGTQYPKIKQRLNRANMLHQIWSSIQELAASASIGLLVVTLIIFFT